MLTMGGSKHPPLADVMFGQLFFYDSNTPAETERIQHGLGCRLLLSELMNVPDGAKHKGRYAIVAERA